MNYNGVLVPMYEVHCRRCEEPCLGLGKSKEKAVESLVDLGWKKVGRYWHCEGCAAETAEHPEKSR
jgi:hypothetical protein